MSAMAKKTAVAKTKGCSARCCGAAAKKTTKAAKPAKKK